MQLIDVQNESRKDLQHSGKWPDRLPFLDPDRAVGDWLQYLRIAVDIVQRRRSAVGNREKYDI